MLDLLTRLCALFRCFAYCSGSLLIACPTVMEDPSDLDAGANDKMDAGPSDEFDGGAGPDSGKTDAGATATGFGSISGECGIIDATVLGNSEPRLLQNAIDFADDPYDPADYDLLTAGGQEIIDDGNAGGSSLYSEVFAYEVLSRCEGAALLKTETEVVYNDPQGKITDLLIELDGVKLGVSVTRAVGFPREDPYTVEDATNILEDKLQGVLDSTANVATQDQWQRQILHVIAYAAQHAESLQMAFTQIDSSLKSDTIIWVTVSDGDDAFLY
jgi:hypothetical protein